MMDARESAHGKRRYVPDGVVDEEMFFPGTYYLAEVDEMYRRSYKVFE